MGQKIWERRHGGGGGASPEPWNIYEPDLPPHGTPPLWGARWGGGVGWLGFMIHKESSRNPLGLPEESSGIPQGFLKGSLRIPGESPRIPQGIIEESSSIP